MFKSSLSVATSVLLSFSVEAFAAESCASVYAAATTSFSEANVQSSSDAYTFSLVCERNGEVKNGDVNLAIEVFELFKGSFGGSKTSKSVHDFCANGVANNGYRERGYFFRADPVTSALQSFNQCRRFEQRNLVISHEINDISGIVITGRFTSGGLSGNINSVVFDKEKMDCKSTSVFEDGASVPVDDDQSFSFGNGGFTITCSRKSIETSGGKFYPSAEVTVISGWGSSYKVTAPSNILNGFDVGNYSLARFEEVKRVERDLRSELSAVNNSLKVASSRISSINPIIISINQGDQPWINKNGSKADVYVTCPQLGGVSVVDPNNQQGWCGSGRRVVSFKLISDIGGGYCGHRLWALTCMPVN